MVQVSFFFKFFLDIFFWYLEISSISPFVKYPFLYLFCHIFFFTHYELRIFKKNNYLSVGLT